MSLFAIKKRLKELERQLQVGETLTLTFADGTQRQIPARARSFFRGVNWLMVGQGDKEATATHRALPQGVRRITENDYDALRRATNLEGPGKAMFSLLRALALGPVEPDEEGQAA